MPPRRLQSQAYRSMGGLCRRRPETALSIETLKALSPWPDRTFGAEDVKTQAGKKQNFARRAVCTLDVTHYGLVHNRTPAPRG